MKSEIVTVEVSKWMLGLVPVLVPVLVLVLVQLPFGPLVLASFVCCAAIRYNP